MNKNTQEEQKNEISLKDFIKERQDLISALGIFAALTLFSHNFLSGPLGETISYLFLFAFTLLLLELWSTFPTQTGSTRLAFFENTLIYTGLCLITYWLAKVWLESIESFIFIISFSLSIFLLNILVINFKKRGVINKIFNQIQPDDSRRYFLGIFIAIVVFVLVFYPVNITLTKVIKSKESSLNNFFEKLIKDNQSK